MNTTTDPDERLDALFAAFHDAEKALVIEAARRITEIVLDICPQATALEIAWTWEQASCGSVTREDGSTAELAELGLPCDASDNLDTACRAFVYGAEYLKPWCLEFDSDAGTARLDFAASRRPA